MPWKETYISEKYRVWGFQNRSYLNPSWSSWPSTGRSTWGTSAAMGIKNWSLKLKSFYINQGWEKLLHKSHKNILFMKIWTLFSAPTVKTPRQKVIKMNFENHQFEDHFITKIEGALQLWKVKIFSVCLWKIWDLAHVMHPYCKAVKYKALFEAS